MRGFVFTPRSIELEAGETITLVLRNADNVEHEFMAGRDPLQGGGYKQDLLALFGLPAKPGEHAMGHSAEGVGIRVAPKGTESITFTVPGAFGTYEIGCFVAGHYEAGMKAALTIEVPGTPRSTSSGASAAPRPLPTLPSQPPAPSATAMPGMDHDMDMEGH